MNEHKITQDNSQYLQNETSIERKTSPTSSIASYKPLEWDSGADVGYLYETGNHQKVNSNHQIQNFKPIEQMVLICGYSTPSKINPKEIIGQQLLSSKTSVTTVSEPDANSSLLLNSVSDSESETEITPIVKSHLTNIVKSDNYVNIKSQKETKNEYDSFESKKILNTFKFPHTIKYDSKNSKVAKFKMSSMGSVNKFKFYNSTDKIEVMSLKKSSSMSVLSTSIAKLPLKRSHSEMNLYKKEKTAPWLIFDSTSSITTVVDNKPITCNKMIQTSIKNCTQESIGVQVSVLKEGRKQQLPKRTTNLAIRNLNSVLTNTNSTCKVQNSLMPNVRIRSNTKEKKYNHKEEDSSNSSHNSSLILETDKNVASKKNSDDNFSGHNYQNISNGNTSQESSVDDSTMPNTSSSIDEKLWENSDSLVCDIEHSVNILKNLVDANQLNKNVKKRLVHHIIKRLINTKYTDDKIEHNLEENVPWNPADARKKVYRTDIIQAFAKNTTESSEDWTPLQKKKNIKKSTSTNEIRTMKNIIKMSAEMNSSISDRSGKNTGETLRDGRKARMGLRADDCNMHNVPTNKSESSECFLPQRVYNINDNVNDIFISSTNSSLQDQNRTFLDAVVNNSPIDSNNEVGDWRLPTTVSEHMYELNRYQNSEVGDRKLVSYAEMEKRNQLIWITNEITHLSNLKKLLEQPIIKYEKIIPSSPQKIKQQTNSKHQKFKTSIYNCRIQTSNITLTDDNLLMSKQWSSHCNLANCSLVDINTISHLKKRNSCTQTARQESLAYSRTGSEIVSAKIQNQNTKLVNVYVQTQRLPQSTITISSTHKFCTDCPVHQKIPVHCTCSERKCLLCRSRNLVQHHLFTDGISGSYNEAKFLCNDLEKEMKNQINKTKLKCKCDFRDKENDAQNVDKPKKSTSNDQICNQCNCEGSICFCRNHKFAEKYSKEFFNVCECEDKLICNFEKMKMNKSAKTMFFNKDSDTNYSCECNKKEEMQNKCSKSNSLSNDQIQTNYVIESSKELNNSQNLCCINESEVKEQSYTCSKNNKWILNDITLSECKCCRVCGIIYKNKKNCECIVKSYPKSVAYELWFLDDNKICDSDFCNKLKMKCMENENLSTNVLLHKKIEKKCMCETLQSIKNQYDCNCANEKFRGCNGENKRTLQEYLTTNNPGFATNVETRRQYISNIQRLRQRQKKSKVQSLSMSTTVGNVKMSPKITKATRCLQKKESDKDMRIKQRNRYFQFSEFRTKRKQQWLQQQIRSNKLMAKIFCKKLQQKVLKGQVDLSQSVSVISNL